MRRLHDHSICTITDCIPCTAKPKGSALGLGGEVKSTDYLEIAVGEGNKTYGTQSTYLLSLQARYTRQTIGDALTAGYGSGINLELTGTASVGLFTLNERGVS